MILKVRPSRELLIALSKLHPSSPFCTPEYVAARVQLGGKPVLLGRMNGDVLRSGAVGFVSRTGWFRTLEIPSFDAHDDPMGWVGLLKRARLRLVAVAALDTYASRSGAIPSFPWPTRRRGRVEHVLDLRQPIRLCSQHIRAVKKAIAAGASVVRLRATDAAVSHQRLVNASLSRRMERGEAVGHVDAEEARSILANGAGEVVQVIVAGEPIASILLLHSAASAYYHSAGTSPAGMNIGASPYLISACAGMLAEDGRSTFNLGDATEDSPGLLRFKRGFGGYEVPLDAATVELLPFTRIGRGQG